MKTQSTQLADRIREVLLSGTWIANTNGKAQISSINWHTANKQIGGLNSIGQLTFHIHYYVAGHIDVLQGRPLSIRDALSFDMPPIQSQEDWIALIDRFTQDEETYASLVEGLSDSALDNDFTDPKYGTLRRNIEAIIEHSYYHLGQITLLKKMLETPPEQ